MKDFPLSSGSTFEQYVERAVRELGELRRRTRNGWKREWLELVQLELAQGVEKARLGDEEESHRLFVDAEIHFRQYERGEQRRITFIAGTNGELEKAK